MASKRRAKTRITLRESRELDRAIDAAGGPRALSRLFKVHPSTLRRWKTRGISEKGLQQLAEFKSFRKTQRSIGSKQREDFKELMEQAGVEDLLPTVRNYAGVRAGPRTTGRRYTKAFGKNLTPELVSSIDSWLHGIAKHYPVWQAMATTSQFGPGKHTGYKTVYYQLKHPDAGDFAISSEVTTVKSQHKGTVINSLTSQLDELAKDKALIVFVHGVTMFNYRMRTEQERKTWESAKRRKRQHDKERRERRQRRK